MLAPIPTNTLASLIANVARRPENLPPFGASGSTTPATACTVTDTVALAWRTSAKAMPTDPATRVCGDSGVNSMPAEANGFVVEPACVQSSMAVPPPVRRAT